MKNPLVDFYRLSNPRLTLLAAVFATLFVILGGGLAWRQMVMKEEYDRMQLRQNHRRILQSAPRGNIYDRNGVLIVGNRSRFSAVLYLNELRPEFRKAYIECVRETRRAWEEKHPDDEDGPKLDRDKLQWQARAHVVQKYLDEINRITGRHDTLDMREFRRHFEQNLVLPFPLSNDLTPKEYALLTAQLPVESPLQVYTDHQRYYPFGQLGFHVLGYVSRTDEPPNEDLPGDSLRTYAFKGKVGTSGIERSFDDILSGQSGGEIWLVDPSGFQYKRVSQKIPRQGKPLTTSLDVELQKIAEKGLAGRKGAVVAIEVQTGEILACASSPTYDLNELSPYIPEAVYNKIMEEGGWLNRAVQGLYPPGSTFKIVTAIAGVRSGVITPETQVNCTGSFTLGNRVFLCHKHSGHGIVDLPAAIEKSCNVFFYDCGARMGIAPIVEEAKRFGLDKPTGIELFEETSRMLVPDPAWKRRERGDGWSTGDTVNVSIGQGDLLVTPLQMTCFVASFARGETRTKPTLVHDATRDAAKINHGGGPIGITPAQYEEVLEGMERSIKTGTSRLANIPNVRLAGKTGTAQVRVKGVPLTLAWFMGFAPVENPQIAVVVMIEGTDPSDGYQGGTTAAPIGGAIMRKYLGIPAGAGLGGQ